MPARWNELFLDERIEEVGNALKKRIVLDLAAVTERNKSLSRQNLVLDSKVKNAVKVSHITTNDISALVRSAKLEQTNGLALMFLVERAVAERKALNSATRAAAPSFRLDHEMAVHVIFFDIATREVLSAQREVHDISTGGSFRNFWFGPIKDTDSDLQKYL